MTNAARAVNIHREPYDTYMGRPPMRDRRTSPTRIVSLRFLANGQAASKVELDELVAGVGNWLPQTRNQATEPAARRSKSPAPTEGNRLRCKPKSSKPPGRDHG